MPALLSLLFCMPSALLFLTNFSLDLCLCLQKIFILFLEIFIPFCQYFWCDGGLFQLFLFRLQIRKLSLQFVNLLLSCFQLVLQFFAASHGSVSRLLSIAFPFFRFVDKLKFYCWNLLDLAIAFQLPCRFLIRIFQILLPFLSLFLKFPIAKEIVKECILHVCFEYPFHLQALLLPIRLEGWAERCQSLSKQSFAVTPHHGESQIETALSSISIHQLPPRESFWHTDMSRLQLNKHRDRMSIYSTPQWCHPWSLFWKPSTWCNAAATEWLWQSRLGKTGECWELTFTCSLMSKTHDWNIDMLNVQICWMNH